MIMIKQLISQSFAWYSSSYNCKLWHFTSIGYSECSKWPHSASSICFRDGI